MRPFLQTIARAYASRYSDLSEVCFLFPNKRSGTFFLKYLKDEFKGHAIMSPETKTITDFVGDLSGLVVGSRLDLIFRLYGCYRDYLGLPVWENEDKEEDENSINFDSFIGWGETVLSDFNEVDLYLDSPEEIFKNVKDFREISSTFLNEEQRKVMEEYFGWTDTGDQRDFWKNFDGDETKLSDVKRKFLHLWRILSPLYESFNDGLKKDGLTTVGGSYRAALRRLKEEGRSALRYKKIVVVGFNALSTVEQEIFRTLKECEPFEGYDAFVDFFWDATGPVLSGDSNSASKFVKANIEAFPCPDWALPALKESDVFDLPGKLRVISSPSNSAQTKIAGIMLEELRRRLTGETFKQAKVAVVLPDENLLFPMLYSFPGGMGDVNLTMGYPLRMTSVVPFVRLLRRLIQNSRYTDEVVSFLNRDLSLFLAHPFAHVLLTSAAVNKILNYIKTHHKMTVSLNEIRELSTEGAEILSVPDKKVTPKVALDYIDSILERIITRLPAFEDKMLKSRLEISHIRIFRDALNRLNDLLTEYKVKMKPSTVYRLVDRLLAGEKVGFEGEPLTGLQVMGMLETRSIDFEYLFILSANERILPMRARKRSFIPDTLRHAFGMPPSNYAEGIFAYYFYRMISRAKEVTMIYDARSGGGLKSGDISRYILQLRYLFAKDRLIEEDWKFVLSGKSSVDPSVFKTPEIKEELESFTKEGGRNLSASALQAYRECQVKFFYKSVLGLSDDPEPSEFIDAISAGNILHEVMMKIYLPKNKRNQLLQRPETITSTHIEKLLEDEEMIERLVRQSINSQHFKLPEEALDSPLSGTSEMVAREIKRQVERVLRHDIELTPFKIHGLEVTDKFTIQISSGQTVNFRFAIDRLDEIPTETGSQMRIVDYKTGSLKLTAEAFEDVFNGDYKSEQVFQLFTYAWLLRKYKRDFPTEDIKLEIYNVPGLENGEINLPVIGSKEEEGDQIKYKEVESYKNYSQEFNEGMEKMLEDIFNSPEFKACEEERCGLCSFRTLCKR